MRIPFWSLVLSALGWLPGRLLPLVLAVVAGPVGGEVFLHLGLSLATGGIDRPDVHGLRGVVPDAPRRLRRVVGRRPGHVGDGPRRTGRSATAVGRTPVVGRVGAADGRGRTVAGRLSRPGPGQRTGYHFFQLLLLTLIVLGMVGSGLAAWLHNYLRRTVAALTGAEDRAG